MFLLALSTSLPVKLLHLSSERLQRNGRLVLSMVGLPQSSYFLLNGLHFRHHIQHSLFFPPHLWKRGQCCKKSWLLTSCCVARMELAWDWNAQPDFIPWRWVARRVQQLAGDSIKDWQHIDTWMPLKWMSVRLPSEMFYQPPKRHFGVGIYSLILGTSSNNVITKIYMHQTHMLTLTKYKPIFVTFINIIDPH